MFAMSSVFHFKCNIIKTLQLIPEERRNIIEEVTMDLSNSMHLIVRRCFRNAKRTIDRFHVQKLACDALQEMRIAHRWDAIQADTDAREEAKIMGKEYKPEILDNGDTRKQLLARSRLLLFKSPEKWTPSQKHRAGILFMLYPDIKEAYSLSHSLRMIYNSNVKRMPRDYPWLVGTTRWILRVSNFTVIPHSPPSGL